MASEQLRRALLAHFDAHRRDMPWRSKSEPYAIWVSEVMLQQTRVDTVRPYYERWLERFPTLDALADADLDDVLREWQGLGYYTRARNLHRAARLVRERHQGQVPGDVATLRALPGVGEYTAGAIASVAFGIATPAVDGNVRRVLSRLYDLEDPRPAELRSMAAGLVPSDRPGDFNQALMELGATICTPRSPDCGLCPLSGPCLARARGTQDQRPRRKAKRPLPHASVTSVILVRGGHRVLLVRRPDHGLLAGLWEFPDQAVPGIGRLRSEARPLTTLDPVVHLFSHRKVTYLPRVYELPDVPGLAPDTGDDGRAWAPLDGLGAFAMPAAQQKMAAALRGFLGGS